MTKLLAQLFLIVAGLGAMLGNYWFTYGLWPQSWWSFAGFGFLTMVLMAMRLAMEDGK